MNFPWSGRRVRRQFCRTPADVPAVAGAYILIVELAEPIAVTIAGRKAGLLDAGRYLYCGSAKGPGGLKARLARHMRHRKSIRWHIDQLTERGTVWGAWIFPAGDECELVRSLSQHFVVALAGFGNSDCNRCRSHLLRWREDMRRLRRDGPKRKRASIASAGVL